MSQSGPGFRIAGRSLEPSGGTRAMTEETIFEVALQKQTPAERAAYLDEACGGDADLRRRVAALLDTHEKVGSFLERPAVEQIAAGVATAGLDFLRPSSAPGSLGRLAHYEVREVLGKGGSGT